MTNLTSLRKYLYEIGPGQISDTDHLSQILQECWHEFRGADVESMAGYKLIGRMEGVEWNPPVLQFEIERHGRTVMGSSRADIHTWQIDINAKTAICEKTSYRQINPMSRRVNVRPLAEEVVQLILQHKTDERLKWNKDGSVRVHIGKILPDYSAVAQTLQGRRKRFRKEVENLLDDEGWTNVGPNVYRPPNS